MPGPNRPWHWHWLCREWLTVGALDPDLGGVLGVPDLGGVTGDRDLGLGGLSGGQDFVLQSTQRTALC